MSGIHRLVLWWVVMVLAAGGCSGLAAAREDASARRLMESLEQVYGPGAAVSQLYVGSEACLACHKDKAGYRDSLHATGLKTVANDAYSMQTKHGIIVDYDGNGIDDFRQGLDFNKISSAFDPFKPNAPVLKYDGGYSIRIGQMTLPVVLAHGGTGEYKQRFLVKIPVTDRPSGRSAGTYYSPIQYNEATRQYVLYETGYWYNADKTPRFSGPVTSAEAGKSKSFDKECSGCHATSLTLVKDPLGEWVASAPLVVWAPENNPHYFDLSGQGVPTAFNIGCERCHGPGSVHIMNLGDKTKVINPANLTAKQANELCGSCHSRGKSKPDGLYDFPYDEANKQDYSAKLGEDLYNYFQDKNGLWPDGVEPKQHHQQFQDFMQSAKWEFPYHKVTCFECHDVHQPTRHHVRASMTYDTPGGQVTIATKVEDNTLCLGCHATHGPFEALSKQQIANQSENWTIIAAVVSQHTRHMYMPDSPLALSRCTECHMAKVATSGASYDIATHTFKAIPPERTLATQKQGGMPNSCSVRCHRVMAPLFGLPADASLTTWNEPSDVAVAEQLKLFYGPDGIWWKTGH